MVPHQALNAYRQTAVQAEIHPVKLIHLMYERALVHLELAEEAIDKADSRKRGENLGKAIAIVSELNASVKSEDQSEAAQFLRGLYGAILVELPKVSLRNDKQIIQRSYAYIKKMKEIWEQTAMQENGFVVDESHEAEKSLRTGVLSENLAGLSVSI